MLRRHKTDQLRQRIVRAVPPDSPSKECDRCERRLFRDDPRAIRFGSTEDLFGYDEIKAFRAARSPADALAHRHHGLRRDVAVASTPFHRPTMPGRVGRQMQTWVRFPEGWRVVAAHVSVIAGEGL
jgi:1-carboxybiuret hydrolase subunit AtzH-like protein